MSCLSESLCDYDQQFQEPLARVQEAESLAQMVMATWTVVRLVAVRLLEEVLSARAQLPTDWPECAGCGR